MNEFYTVADLAKKYDRCVASVRRWFQKGQIPGAVQVGGRGTYQVPRYLINGTDEVQPFEPPAMGRPKAIAAQLDDEGE